MTVYTCIRRKDTNFYECMEGFYEYFENDIVDYKIVSLPPSHLNFQIFREYFDYIHLKYSFPKEYRNNLVFHFSGISF